MTLRKIISGGQTGADQGGLDAALEREFPHGGWCPKGRKSENGKIPDKYLLTEYGSGYPPRTRKNVQDSDGTLIVTQGEVTGGTKLTIDIAEREKRPCFVINMSIVEDCTEMMNALSKWMETIGVLNVAGPRESKVPGIQEKTKDLVSLLIRKWG